MRSDDTAAGPGKLRDRLEMINSSSRVKLKADPQPDMLLIRSVADMCIRHHPTLALSTWLSTIKAIRQALENVEDIYRDTHD